MLEFGGEPLILDQHEGDVDHHNHQVLSHQPQLPGEVVGDAQNAVELVLEVDVEGQALGQQPLQQGQQAVGIGGIGREITQQ